MEKTTRRKRIPYGMMNFIDVREDNCYYVDKTRFIPMIEDANKYFFYIRPRRFGKSLTVSMLHHYYNILDADNFEKWYGDLYIGQHPTPERNSYLIIYLNFAVVNAELHSYRQSLDAHCNTEFNFFCDIYAQYLPQGIKEGLNAKRVLWNSWITCTKNVIKPDKAFIFLLMNTTILPIRFYPNPHAWTIIEARHTAPVTCAVFSTP